MSYRCRPCGAPLTGADKCEYCGCLTHAPRAEFGPSHIDADMIRHLRAHSEMQRAMMQNQSGLQQRGMLFSGVASGALGGLFR